MASMARSKKRKTPPTRKKPPVRVVSLVDWRDVRGQTNHHYRRRRRFLEFVSHLSRDMGCDHVYFANRRATAWTAFWLDSGVDGIRSGWRWVANAKRLQNRQGISTSWWTRVGVDKGEMRRKERKCVLKLTRIRLIAASRTDQRQLAARLY